jgi:hypothetical protein
LNENIIFPKITDIQSYIAEIETLEAFEKGSRLS